jgi:RNA polymerase sigma-70 factor (ECF subfamily)
VPEADAKDATQEVFMVVHRKLDEFEGRSKITRWLFAICLRVASDRRKKASFRREVLQDSILIDQSSQSIHSGANAEQRENARRLEQVLDNIPLDQRAVFVLFELEGMTGAEIGELLDIPVPTVHSRLRLARETFHQSAQRYRAHDSFEASRLGGQP